MPAKPATKKNQKVVLNLHKAVEASVLDAASFVSTIFGHFFCPRGRDHQVQKSLPCRALIADLFSIICLVKHI
jgi:hypothetical protein